MYGPWITTKHLTNETFAKVAPHELTEEEKQLIQGTFLGYCETHQNLYRKISRERLAEIGGGQFLLECPVKSIACQCDDPACTAPFKYVYVKPCKEWGPA